MKPHPPWKSRCGRARTASAEGFRHPSRPMPTTERLVLRSWRPSDRAPFARLNADPEVVRFLNDGVPFTQRPERRAVRRHPGPLGAARVRPVVRRRARGPRRVPGLRRPGGALVPAVGPARGRGRLAPGPSGVGTRPGDRGRTSVCAPRLRDARARGGDLDHRPGQRALDPRGGEARDAPRCRPRASANPPQIARLRDFLARCGFFTWAILTPATRLAYVRSRRGTEPQRARPWGCEARRSEATALPREPTWRRAPQAARDRVAFVKAHLVE